MTARYGLENLLESNEKLNFESTFDLGTLKSGCAPDHFPDFF